MNKLIARHGMGVWHRHFLWIGLGCATCVLIIGLCLIPQLRGINVLFPIVAAVLGFFYFLQQNHLQTARFCKELVTDFNKRYDTLNNSLQSLLQKDKAVEFSKDEKLVFVDYFNLCAEEHLFHKLGYIYKPIWESWHNGMKQYAKEPRIARIWATEKDTNSYYGFKLPVK